MIINAGTQSRVPLGVKLKFAKDLFRKFGRNFIHVSRHRVGRKRIPTSPASPFYGYPAEVIAEWCGVSIGTAEHYKAGRRKPPTPVLRLFRLYRDGKVLGRTWDQYKIVAEKLFCPDGRFVTEAHISHLTIVCEMLAEKDPEVYDAILRKVESA